jgi:hypothetical protein
MIEAGDQTLQGYEGYRKPNKDKNSLSFLKGGPYLGFPPVDF